ncbi:MAG TPA: zf-HC2 domain-containing protein, partial [Gemmatimonadales bacterium]|nr:zf-HC2 domain-containing protein [Gemmatimonadales bacterium]
MTTGHWTSRLSEYLDNELSAPERAAADAHLRTCAACRGTLDELRAVTARAHALADRAPANDLWP